MNEPSVSVKNLTKSFSGRRVVDNLSFDVQKGEVFALLGHNGAGKSTTIDLILGLKAPEGGFTKILGTNAAKNRKKVFERVGVQLQNTQYQPNITVEEACIEYASLYSAPADYQQLLEQFGLIAFKKSFVSKLSGGERQRVKLAKYLDKQGNIYVLDEPTTGLHAPDVQKIMKLLDSLVDRGNTVIVIEHNLDVMKQSDWLIDVGPDGGTAGGEIVFTGTPKEMAEHGKTITAEYLRKSL